MSDNSPAPALNPDTLRRCFSYLGYDAIWKLSVVNRHIRHVALPLAVRSVDLRVISLDKVKSLEQCLAGGYACPSNVREMVITTGDEDALWLASVGAALVQLLSRMAGLRKLQIVPLEHILTAYEALALTIANIPNLERLDVDWAGPVVSALLCNMPRIQNVSFASHRFPHLIQFGAPVGPWKAAALVSLHVQDFFDHAFDDCSFPALQHLIVGTDLTRGAGSTMDVDRWSRACPQVCDLTLGGSTILHVAVRPSPSFPNLATLSATSVHIIALGFAGHVASVTMLCKRAQNERHVAQLFDCLAALKPNTITLRGHLGSYHRVFDALRTVVTARVCVIDATGPTPYREAWNWVDNFYVSLTSHPRLLRLLTPSTAGHSPPAARKQLLGVPSRNHTRQRARSSPHRPGVQARGASIGDRRTTLLRSEKWKRWASVRELRHLGWNRRRYAVYVGLRG